MTLYTRLCSTLLFPLHERLKHHSSVAVRRRLEKSQWWSADQLERYRIERLRHFLAEIGSNVPYYRQLFSAIGFDPLSVNTVRDIECLPLQTKTDIRAHCEALKSEVGGLLSRYNTGGSSGEPLIFFMGRNRKSHDVGAKWRATRWWNVDIGDRELVVWGSPVELNAQDYIRRARDALMRSHLLPAFEMSEANLDRFVATIRRFRPKMLFGYPSSLSVIADHAIKRGIALDELGIKVAFVTSERLYEYQRELIQAVFGCPVANGYGARDAGFIAHECPSGSLHVSAEDIIVETLGADDKPVAIGEAGEIVITHMGTGDFPFVRYRTGDIGVLGGAACSCGRNLPILTEVHGRATDFVVTSTGTLMHGLSLIYTVRDLPGVKQFKIVQQSLLRTDVSIVRGPGWDVASETRILRDFHDRLGHDVEVNVSYFNTIDAEKSGKYRYVVSKVEQPARASHANR